MLLIPAVRRQRQVDLCKFEASLVYRVSSRPPGLHRETLSQEKKEVASPYNRILFGGKMK